MCFRLVSVFTEVKIFNFWPKTMDYSQAFWPKLSSCFALHSTHVAAIGLPKLCLWSLYVQREYDSVIQAGVESQYEASMLPHKQAWGASEEHTIRSVRSGVVFELECWYEQELSDAGERTSR